MRRKRQWTTAIVLGFMAAVGVMAPSAAKGQDVGARGIIGTWQGVLVAGGARLRVVFRVTEAPDGGLEATMDSPDQGAMGIPIAAITLTGDSVRFDIASVGARYVGRLAGGGEQITGEWVQGAARVPLELGRGEPGEVRRPQEPEGPLPYVSEEVEIVGGDELSLAGTLTLPPGSGPHPAVVLLSGSGPQDRDGGLAGHRPFLVLADHLTRAGIAVLRTDDRGVGGSGGSTFTTTLADRAADTGAMVAHLRGRREIDRGRVGLVAHSEGGWVAPLVARAAPDHVAFLVLLAGPGLSPGPLLLAQQAAILRASGADEATLDAMAAFTGSLFDVLAATPDPARADERLQQLATEVAARLPAAQAQALEAYLAGQSETERLSSRRAANTPWFRDLIAFDVAPAWRGVHQPVLALFGGRDLQVPPAENVEPLRLLMGADHRPDRTVTVLPDLNHFFQPARTGLPEEYATIETTLAPEALDVITGWIRAH